MSRGTTRSNPGSLVSGLAAKLNELERAVTRQTERFAAIIEVGTQISAARDVDQLLGTVMDRLTGLLEVEAATLYMFDETTGELWSRAMKGAQLTVLRIPADTGLAGHVFRTRKTLMLGDAYNDPRFNPDVDKQTGFRTRSMIATPLQHMSGRVLGVLQVLDRRVDAFTTDDKVLVEGVANQIAAVLDNVLLVNDLEANRALLEQRVRELDALFDIEQAISPSSDHKDLLDRILTRAMEATGALAGSILLVEEDRDNSLHFRTAKGSGSEALKELRLAEGQGIAGHVAATGAVVRVAHASESEHHDRAISRKLGVPIEAALCVPIAAEGRRLGALELLNNPAGFSAADEKLAVVLAGQIGRAMEDLQTREERERLKRLSTIGQMLAGVLHDLRTPLTVIAGYSEMMATEADGTLRAEMSKAIVGQLQLVNAMQQETLAFARGERTVLLRRVYLNLFMREVSTQLLQEFASSKVELKVQVTYSGAARFDENKIRRSIFNLARNSIEAMPQGGRFVLQVDREGSELVFRASDNGPGIPPEIADKLFESFVTSGKKDGTGLGLAMVRKIAKEHQGSVSCKSKPGKGTVFELRFPCGTPVD